MFYLHFMMMPVKHPFSSFGNVHFECLTKYPGGTDQYFEFLGLKMCLHGWACPPHSNHAKCVFLFGILVHAVAKTAFFFTNFACKRAHAFDKFIRFVWLGHDLYPIEKQRIRLQLVKRSHSRVMKIMHKSNFEDNFRFWILACGLSEL